jgi:hypothetical protein
VPTDDKGRRHAHLLALGFEEENLFPPLRGSDGAEAFFRDRRIQWWKSSRSGDDFGTVGPTRNLASSQVACVNFLLPLAESQEGVNALMRRLDATSQLPASIRYNQDGLALSSLVELEWVGLTKSLEATDPRIRGANTTSADALLVADLPSGGRRAYLIEWKFVEEYKADEDLGEGSGGATRRARYRQMFSASGSPFTSDLSIDDWLYEPFYQIMRLLLLGQKMADEKELGVTEAVVAVVCPEENTAYRDRITSPGHRERYPHASGIVEVVRSSLRQPSAFLIVSQLELLRSVAATGDLKLGPWLAYHRDRYGWSPVLGE